MTSTMCCLFFLILHLLLVSGASARDWLSPPYTWLYQFPLPIPPVKTPKWTTLNPITNKSIDYYEINILPLTQNVYPGKAPAKLVGYDGVSPGPTFRVERGTEAVVRFINNSTTNSSIHLHGSYSRAPWDGWAEDVTGPGQYKDYYYPNHQAARTLWYHDHSLDHTAERAYFGQAGVYILHDPAEDDLNLPRDAYDVPLVLASKQYNSDGTLFSPALETTSLYGDVIHVNGQPWPYFNVEARPYRFRLLDASISRSFFLYFERDTRPGEKLEFQVVGSDAGLLGSPQKTTDLYISMAERYEVVVDFSKWKGENITLRNTRGFAVDEDFLHSDKVMRFVVGDQSVSGGSNSIHSPLRTIPFPLDKSTIDHVFRFERIQGEWKINGVSFADIKNRVLARPARGRVELWQLINGGGGWSHPVHIHLIDFKVVQRKNGRNQVFSYEAAGLKDVVWLGPGEEVLVEAVFAPWDGVYMFHCHNLIHEDHDMMGAFNVSYLADLGYNETHYIDPMETRWRAKPYSATAMQESVIRDKIADMAREQPYNLVDDVEGVLDRYWATATVGGTASTTVTTVGGTRSATTMTTTTRS